MERRVKIKLNFNKYRKHEIFSTNYIFIEYLLISYIIKIYLNCFNEMTMM